MSMKLLLLVPLLMLAACGGNTRRKPADEPAGTLKLKHTLPSTADPEVINGHERVLGPNGALKMEGDKKDGKRTGVWTSYTGTGRVRSKSEYRDGRLEGVYTVFRDNGELYYQGQHRNDKQVGTWKFYDERGNLEKTVRYDTTGTVINDPR